MTTITRTSVPNSEAVSRGYNFASTWEQNAPLTEQQHAAIVSLSHPVVDRPFPSKLFYKWFTDLEAAMKSEDCYFLSKFLTKNIVHCYFLSKCVTKKQVYGYFLSKCVTDKYVCVVKNLGAFLYRVYQSRNHLQSIYSLERPAQVSEYISRNKTGSFHLSQSFPIKGRIIDKS